MYGFDEGKITDSIRVRIDDAIFCELEECSQEKSMGFSLLLTTKFLAILNVNPDKLWPSFYFEDIQLIMSLGETVEEFEKKSNFIH